ncbi:MAG: MFS transporter [Candidatus Eremiobacteraeota bacterium]|nr:MFS transporter [Candidatus Eremiobacteraeota bacterium]
MPRALIPILSITFVDVLGFSILIPILPFYAQRFGASPLIYGFIFTMVALAALLASPVWGRLSDRVGRKRILIYSQLGGVLGYGILGMASGLPMIFLGRTIEGIGGGNIGVTQSYISDVTAPEQRARAFALMGATWGVGFLFGPVLGGTLVAYGYPVPFFAAAALQCVTILLTIFLLPESHKPLEGQPSLRDVANSFKDARLRTPLLQQLFFALAFFQWVSVLSFFLQRIFNYGPRQTSYLFAVSAVISVIVQVAVIGRAVDRFGERRVCIVGFALALIAYIMLGTANSLGLFLIVLGTLSLASALIRPTLTALTSHAAPADKRGALFGISDSLNSFALLVGPPIAGLVFAKNVHWIGVAPAICTCIAITIAIGSRSALRAANAKAA